MACLRGPPRYNRRDPMKTCPECGRNFPDEYSFCLDDGSDLSEPLAGEKTVLLKGPIISADDSEQATVDRRSIETVLKPTPQFVPAPTEASPLPTIKSFEPLRSETPSPVKAPPEKVAQKSGATATVNWVLGTVFLAAAVGLILFFMNYQPGAASNANQSVNAPNALQSRPITPNPNLSATSNTRPAASRPGQPLTATGVTEAETTEQDMVAHDKRGTVVWSVKPGDFVEQCGGGNLGMATRYNDPTSGPEGSSKTTTADAITWSDPVVVLSLDVANAGTYVSGQRLARLGRVQHMLVNANFQPSDAGRLTRGLRVVFTDAGHTRDFNGAVDSIDSGTGRVRILLDDKDIFVPDNPKCLTITPNVAGTVRFTR